MKPPIPHLRFVILIAQVCALTWLRFAVRIAIDAVWTFSEDFVTGATV